MEEWFCESGTAGSVVALVEDTVVVQNRSEIGKGTAERQIEQPVASTQCAVAAAVAAGMRSNSRAVRRQSFAERRMRRVASAARSRYDCPGLWRRLRAYEGATALAAAGSRARGTLAAHIALERPTPRQGSPLPDSRQKQPPLHYSMKCSHLWWLQPVH